VCRIRECYGWFMCKCIGNLGYIRNTDAIFHLSEDALVIERVTEKHALRKLQGRVVVF